MTTSVLLERPWHAATIVTGTPARFRAGRPRRIAARLILGAALPAMVVKVPDSEADSRVISRISLTVL
jgi:hypothetical protein